MGRFSLVLAKITGGLGTNLTMHMSYPTLNKTIYFKTVGNLFLLHQMKCSIILVYSTETLISETVFFFFENHKK